MLVILYITVFVSSNMNRAVNEYLKELSLTRHADNVPVSLPAPSHPCVSLSCSPSCSDSAFGCRFFRVALPCTHAWQH